MDHKYVLTIIVLLALIALAILAGLFHLPALQTDGFLVALLNILPYILKKDS